MLAFRAEYSEAGHDKKQLNSVTVLLSTTFYFYSRIPTSRTCTFDIRRLLYRGIPIACDYQYLEFLSTPYSLQWLQES